MDVKIAEAVSKLVPFMAPAAEETPESTLSLFATKKSTASAAARPVDIEFAFLTAPETHRVPLYIELPNEVYSGSVCLVTPAPQRKYKETLAKFEENPAVARVEKIIDVKKLAATFNEPVACRALARTYDAFFVHYGVRKFPAQLAGEWVGHARSPIWMNSKKGNIVGSVEAALRTTVMPRRGFPSVTIRVGHTGLTQKQLVENIIAAIAAVDSTTVLTVKVCGCDSKGRKAGLTVHCHDYLAEYPEMKKQ